LQLARTSKVPGILKRLQNEGALLITPPTAFEAMIRGKNTLPAKGGSPAFTFYRVEVNMQSNVFQFIKTGQYLTARE
jgi:hypothetical protein